MPHSSFPLQVSPTIPQPLRRLADLAENFWFSWYPETGQLFRKLDAVLWRKVEGNPKLFLRCVDQGMLDRAAADGAYLAEYEELIGAFDAYLRAPGAAKLADLARGRPRRVFLRRIRPARELPDLLGRSRRARGRPLQDRQRPESCLRRGRDCCTGRATSTSGSTATASSSRTTPPIEPRSTALTVALDGAGRELRVDVPVPGSRRRVARLARARRPRVGAAARHRRGGERGRGSATSPTFSTAATASTASARRRCSASAACAPCARSGSRRRCGTSTRVTPRSR